MLMQNKKETYQPDRNMNLRYILLDSRTLKKIDIIVVNNFVFSFQ